MTAPDMATITASLERSLQNCSLNHSSSHGGDGSAAEDGIGISSTSDDALPENISHSDGTLELNSQISLPYYWQQFLDVKTGEIYYINWRNGMKAKEDPRTMAEYSGGGGEEVEDEEGELYYSDYESSYDSEGSSSESPPSSSRDQQQQQQQQQHHLHHHYRVVEKDHVLVVAGCKSCLMYFMVPKQVEDCPKCAGQLLHFDRSEPANASP